MNYLLIKPLVVLLFLLAISNEAISQMNHWRDSWKTNSRITTRTPTFYQRAHFGYTHNIVFAQQQQMRYIYKPDGTFTEEKLTRTVRTLGGSGFSVGSFFTLTRFRSDVVALALSADFNYNKMSWEELDSGFTYRPKLKDFKTTDFTIQMGMPVSLDLKLGSDAMPSNNYKWAASFGAGVCPVLAFTDRKKKKILRDPLHVSADYMPFVKFEVGRRVGVLMKLRVLMMFGGPEYLDEFSTPDGKAITDANKYSLTGKFSTNISLLVYPFSYKWPEYGWWQ